MSDDWREIPFGEFTTLQRGADLPVHQRRDGVYPVLASNGVVGFHDAPFATGPGVVTGRSGTIGKPTFIRGDYWPLNTVLWVNDFHGNDPHFVYFYFQFFDFRSYATGTSVPTLNRNFVHSVPIRVPPKPEQEKIAAMLWKIQRAIEVQEKLVATSRELKQAAMRQLFTCGLRNERQKETDIGRIPKSWNPTRLDDCCNVVTSSLSYTDFERMDEETKCETALVMGIKVSDMNLPGNETSIVRANLQKRIAKGLAEKKLVPPDTVVFPKRGAAIATNKKRRTTAWTVFDPNLIGVRPAAGVDCTFLFYWFQNFDLRTITEPGPTPQLNKKNLTPLLLPIPNNVDEQAEIGRVLLAIDKKISIHERKRTTLQELFTVMLHKLMTGQIRLNKFDINVGETRS